MLGRIIMIILLFTKPVFATDCEEMNLRCSVASQTRKVNGVDVHRDCWEYQYQLGCHRKSKDDCSTIDVNKCHFMGEECLDNQTEGDLVFCGNLKRKFSCEKDIEWTEEKTELLKNGEVTDSKDLLCAFKCLDGNCDAVKKAAMEEDSDLAMAAGMLNSLKEMKDGIEGDTIVNIFKGSREQCDKKLLEYTNCCTKMGGWGKILGASCSDKAQSLAKRRKDKKCVKVGMYCSSELPILGCIIERTVFCCYDSVIGKILNQEAKKQLGKSNGTVENPQCGGLSLEEIERVDFSKADFKEFYDEVVVPNINIPDIAFDAKSNVKSIEEMAKNPALNGMNENILKDVE